MQLLTTFDGRIGRSGWWTGVLVLIVLGLIAGFVVRMALAGGGLAATLVGLAVTLVLFGGYAAISAKRLHDRGKATMPWLAIFLGPGLLLNVMQRFEIGFAEQMRDVADERVLGAAVMVPNALGAVVITVAAVTALWTLAELGLMRGDPGENAWGKPPV